MLGLVLELRGRLPPEARQWDPVPMPLAALLRRHFGDFVLAAPSGGQGQARALPVPPRLIVLVRPPHGGAGSGSGKRAGSVLPLDPLGPRGPGGPGEERFAGASGPEGGEDGAEDAGDGPRGRGASLTPGGDPGTGFERPTSPGAGAPRSGTPDPLGALIQALESLGPVEGAAALAVWLEEAGSARLREELALALGQVGGGLAWARLGALVAGDPDPGVRLAAVAALSTAPPAQAREWLELARTDSDPEVRKAAQSALDIGE